MLRTINSGVSRSQENHGGHDIEAVAEDATDEPASPSPRPNTASRPKESRRITLRRPKPAPASHSDGANPTVPDSNPLPSTSRFSSLPRRSTMPDSGALSEDEGRNQLSPSSKKKIFVHRKKAGEAEDVFDDTLGPTSASARKRMNIRRISVFGSGASGSGTNLGQESNALVSTTPRRPFFGADRATTYGATRWKQVKSTLGMLRKKEPDAFEHLKSAELVREIQAVTPMVAVLASTMLMDEHGNRRIPVLLEQVKISIRDSHMQKGDSERHTLFTIDLQYGSGESRMTWTVHRTIREILNLHVKYKLARNNERVRHAAGRTTQQRGPKQPHFPTKAFPYLRNARGLGDSSDEEEDLVVPEQVLVAEPEDLEDGDDATPGSVVPTTPAEKRPAVKKRKSRMSALTPKRHMSGNDDGLGVSVAGQVSAAMEAAAARRKFVEDQKRMLEKYLQEMVRWLMFRADSNRLCRFLELSALGVRLAGEGSFHGKECFMHIQSAKGLDFRRVLTPAKVIARHTRKWFLVRQSYIACVESPEVFDIYDVYLVDPEFKIITQKSRLQNLGIKSKDKKEITAKDPLEEEDDDGEIIDLDLTQAKKKKKGAHHTLKIITSERKITLVSFNQHLIQQFQDSIHQMMRKTPWIQRNRFGSFAPVRTRCSAQWLVDGRDYMWNVSRAIAMAKDVIYIHDWWLSPEIYMRRPPCISQKWRLDRLLQRKAREGVKIFIIVYRNVEAAVPIDSEYTKQALLNLHPNIFVQRSPNQFKKNQFFFAHHEKVLIVDHYVAFLGGLDLCFGRWDTPDHSLTDNKLTGFEEDFQSTPKDSDHCQLFPGKDYSNPRIQDFFRLREPYEEMYDREKVPRMPWHDVSMQVVGQPARDLTRHFVQRWNYVRRGRKPTRPLPFLLPPPDFGPEDLESMGLDGTCEVQMLRSASTWSLGINTTEASIQEAYLRMIEQSEHFVYIENQFFITSTETMGVRIHNRIGDALVERIIRAHENDEDWKCIVVIPLMPGFQNTVAEQEGTSVRLILQCQFRSISRGESSIFGRLRAAGIDPEEYISFFSLRKWGRIGGIGKEKMLVSEQLYIHAKTIIVDDRVALIGSANINERSMVGYRDSETACIVRDTDMIWSTMAGKPYRVGRFAHTLRLRLMREHLGLDVDEILEEERHADAERHRREADFEAEMDEMYERHGDNLDPNSVNGARRRSTGQILAESAPPLERGHSVNHDADLQQSVAHGHTPSTSSAATISERPLENPVEHKRDVAGLGPDHWKQAQEQGLDQGRDSIVVNGHEVLLHNISSEGKGSVDKPKMVPEISLASDTMSQDSGVKDMELPPMPPFGRRTTDQLGLKRANQLPPLPLTDDSDIGGPTIAFDEDGKPFVAPPNPFAADIQPVVIDKDCMRDPLDPEFYEDVWKRSAVNNTKLYRRVFRCMPDDEVMNWRDYTEYLSYQIRFRDLHEPKREASKDGSTTTTTTPGDSAEKVQAQAQDITGNMNEKQSAGGGAGISAPGPQAIGKSLKDKLSPFSHSKSTNEKADGVSNLPDNTMAAGGHAKAGDKSTSDRPARHIRQDSRLDVEKAAAEFRALATPLTTPFVRPPPSADSTLPPISRDGNTVPVNGMDYLRPTTQKGEKRTSFAVPELEEFPIMTDGSLHANNIAPPPLTPSSRATTAAGAAAAATTTTVNGKPTTPSTSTAKAGPSRRRRATTRGSRGRSGYPTVDDVLDKEEAESLVGLIQGHLVQFPHDWLITEESNGNWLYPVDQVAPLQIYD